MRLGERNLELLTRLNGNRVLEDLGDGALLQERTALARHTIGGHDREVLTRRLLKLFKTRAAGSNHPRSDGGVNLDQEGLRGRLHRVAAHLAQIVESKRLVTQDATLTRTRCAFARHDLAHAVGHVLARHLDETQGADRDEVDLRTILRELFLECRDDCVAVGLRLHVDEVDHDDAAKIAQPQLANDLSGRLEVVVHDRVFESPLTDKAAGVDVDDREGLCVIEQEVATRRKIDATLERALDCLVDAVAPQQFCLSRVAMNARDELGAALLHVRDDAIVGRLVVDDQLVDILAKIVTHEAQSNIDLCMDGRRRYSGLAALDHSLPLIFEQREVALQLDQLCTTRGRPHDQTATETRCQLLDEVAQTIALTVGKALRDTATLAVRHVDQEAACQRHVHRDASALRLHRVLRHLHEQRLATLDEVLDALRTSRTLVESVNADLGDVEERVLVHAGIDKGCLHARQHGVDLGEIDVAEQGSALVALDVRLDDTVVFDQGCLCLVRIGRN